MLNIDMVITMFNRKIPKCDSLKEVAMDVVELHISKRTKALDRLPELKKLRYLVASEIGEEHFRQTCSATQITHLKAVVPTVKSLDPLRNLKNLRALSLFQNARIESLDGIEELQNLEYLSMGFFNTQFALNPLSRCIQLRYLWMSSTIMGRQYVDSLGPLSPLTKLERLILSGTRVRDRKLTPLHGLKKLIEIRLTDYFPPEEFTALAVALPNARGEWLDIHVGRRPNPLAGLKAAR